ncbi:uncharacterized protein LOC142219460 [Haematobia irritans]|uniref:uncharacterized protein LOC142219460 n=1 Tax=Haematobia irritans TaxID=7368 RepID=UPI003F4FB086
MYKFSSFGDKWCHFVRHNLNFYNDDCGDYYSIWFDFKRHWKSINAYYALPLCTTTWFPIIYWTVLASSIWGLIYSLTEFFTVLRIKNKPLVMKRERIYKLLSHSVLRKFRLLGALVMIISWVSLCYALINVLPSNMIPWLLVNFVGLVSDTILWIMDIYMDPRKMNLRGSISIALPFVIYWLVCCVRSVFQMAVRTNSVIELRLFKDSIIKRFGLFSIN